MSPIATFRTRIWTEITTIILPFALPIMAEQGFIMLMGLVNAGMASSAGTAVAAAVGLVNGITNVVISLFSALALGGTVAVAKYCGARDRETARNAAGQTLTLCLATAAVAGILMVAFARPVVDLLFGLSSPEVRTNARIYLRVTALGYPFVAMTLSVAGIMRGAGDVRSPMLINIFMNFINVIAGRLFILGFSLGGLTLVPPLGAAGAAMAITVARTAGAVIFFLVLFRGESVARPRARAEFIPTRRILGLIFAVSIPASVESLLFNGGKLITQTFLAGLGEVAMTADYLSTMVASFLQVPGSGLSLAVTPLVGTCLGRGDREGARRTILSSLVLGTLSEALVAIPGFFFSSLFFLASTSRPEVVATGNVLLRLFLIANPLIWSTSFIIPSGLRGAGDGRFTMWISIGSMWFFRIGLGWLLSHPLGWGVAGIWVAMFVDWLVRSIFFVSRILSDRWFGRI